MGIVDLTQFEFLITLFSILLVTGLGFFVWFHKKDSVTNLIFFALCFSIALWGLINYLGFNGPSEYTLLLVRLTIASAVPHSILFFSFIHTFPSEKLRMKRIYFLALLFLIFITSLVSLSSLVFPTVEIIDGRPRVPIVGPGMVLFALVVIGGFLSGVYLMFKRFKHSPDNTTKTQWKIIITAFVIMFILLIIFDLLAVALFKNSSFVPYSPLFVLPFVILTAYAIAKHGLLQIKVVATEVLTLVVVFTLLIDGFTSETVVEVFVQIIFATFMAVMGFLLVRSVNKEIKQREILDHFAKKLKKANVRLKELDELKTEFMSIASHQLRTPLSVIKGYVSLIQEGVYGRVNKKMYKILDNMDVSNEHLIRLVDEFLNISRIEQGRLKYDFAPCDITSLVKESLKALKTRANSKGLKLNFENKLEHVKEFVADREKIHHVVYNFIDNAIKYTEEGHVTVIIEEEDGGLTCRVRDTGLGFGSEDQANFFQKFYRGRNVKGVNITGTGLGLYVSRKFIEAHHGKIWAKSPGPGKGAEFGFWLPQLQD